MKKLALRLIISIAVLGPGFSSYSQSLPIAFVEVFGNRKVSANEVIQKAGIHEGDTLTESNFDGDLTKARIRSLPTVKLATLEAVCCQPSGGWVIFIGISESDSSNFKYRKNPTGSVTLPKEMTQNYNDLMEANEKAVMSGNSSEDRSLGYSLMNDSACRRIEKKFIGYANNNLELLQKVIHESSDPEQRIAATCIIAYNDNKQKFIPDLLYAVSDSSEGVRNDATRALGILAEYAQTHPSLNIEIPPAPFITMIHSFVWTDRNKGTFVLEGLTRSRNKELLISLKKNSLPELIEMAKWRSKGHAYPAFYMLGRIADINEEEIGKLFDDYIKNIELIVQKINKL